MNIFTEKIEFLGFHTSENNETRRIVVLLELKTPIKALNGITINKLPFYFSSGKSGGASENELVFFNGIIATIVYNYYPGSERNENNYKIWNKNYNLSNPASLLYKDVDESIRNDTDIQASLHFMNIFYIKCYVNTLLAKIELVKALDEETVITKIQSLTVDTLESILKKLAPELDYLDQDIDAKFCNEILQNIANKFQINKIIYSGKFAFVSYLNTFNGSTESIRIKELTSYEVNDKIGDNNVYGFNINDTTSSSRISAYSTLKPFLEKNIKKKYIFDLNKLYTEQTVCLPTLSDIYLYLTQNY